MQEKDRIKSAVRGSFPRRIMGCCCEKESAALARRPTTLRRPPDPMVGFRQRRVFDGLRDFPADGLVSSSATIFAETW